jgi:plastocyanin
VKTSIRKLCVGWLLVVGLSLILLTACRDERPAQPPLEVTLHAQDIQFDRTQIQAKVGQPVRLTYINEGTIDHSLIITGFVEAEKIRPGETLTFTFTPEEAGQFKYVCHLPGHELAGMVGTLTVAPSQSVPAAQTTPMVTVFKAPT